MKNVDKTCSVDIETGIHSKDNGIRRSKKQHVRVDAEVGVWLHGKRVIKSLKFKIQSARLKRWGGRKR